MPWAGGRWVTAFGLIGGDFLFAASCRSQSSRSRWTNGIAVRWRAVARLATGEPKSPRTGRTATTAVAVCAAPCPGQQLPAEVRPAASAAHRESCPRSWVPSVMHARVAPIHWLTIAMHGHIVRGARRRWRSCRSRSSPDHDNFGCLRVGHHGANAKQQPSRLGESARCN
jgi:hypothetical protein